MQMETKMLKPTGFWSYSHLDEESSLGQLGLLRDRVRGALQLEIGQKVSIFLDSTSIAFGSTWERQIGEALEDVSFFIPILTRGFLQSKYCCDEVMIFRSWEESRGRDDLIFPIQYTDIDEFDRCQSNEKVLNLLRSRMMADLSSWQSKSDDLIIEKKIAKAIRNSLWKAGMEINSTMTKAAASVAQVQLVNATNDHATSPTAEVQSTTPPALSEEFLDKLYERLLNYVGPNPKSLVDKLSQGVTSPYELVDRLEKSNSIKRLFMDKEETEKLSNLMLDLAEQYEPRRWR